MKQAFQGFRDGISTVHIDLTLTFSVPCTLPGTQGSLCTAQMHHVLLPWHWSRLQRVPWWFSTFPQNHQKNCFCRIRCRRHRSTSCISYEYYVMALCTLLHLYKVKCALITLLTIKQHTLGIFHSGVEMAWCSASHHFALRKYVVKCAICSGSFVSYLLFHVLVFRIVGGGCSGMQLSKRNSNIHLYASLYHFKESHHVQNSDVDGITTWTCW